MQPAFIITSARKNYLGIYARMNQIYKLKKSIRRKEMDVRSPIQYCLHLATEHNNVAWTYMDSNGQLT